MKTSIINNNINEKNEPKTIYCDFDFCDLYIQAEGGWGE
jgi:hypothetical protein